MSKKKLLFSRKRSGGIIIVNGFNYFKGGLGVVGTSVTDQFGNGNNGTLRNSPTINADNFELNGTDQDLKLNNGIFTGDYTIFIKFKLDTIVNDMRLISSLSGGISTYTDSITSTGVYRVWSPILNGSVSTGITFNTTSTYKIAIVRNGATTSYYLDGVLITTLNLSNNLNNASIGAKYQEVHGLNSNLKLYSSVTYTGALNATEVYNNNLLL